MASAAVAPGRQAEDALPPPGEPPLPETKPLQPPQPPSVAAPQSQQSPAPRPQSPGRVKGEENYSFLPLVHNIIKCMDKDSPDIHQDLNALRTKFQEMRKVISTMPGTHLSPEQQQRQLHSLREQVRTKSELLQKYKSLCMFEVPKD
ncbi:mediator of RNA polymerase II transcription subunit 9 [Manis pentadactyla]|uniref:mediator of RNA polymerase II transcription subunit 9 n=1 Tax=Manis pentadactyla TaxID=143292 RepID=UPI001873A48E|nr:mediator of RNA polymerase II transcription subunit 9 [Manis pentadactyla]XP_036749976.1 mediator of RNA polymerase II transcription subunit 9 [Manis pentadactyla]KAI5269553.1 Mediator Of Rna polymerase Ii Transcription Subunit 9 [Manis pentadactyla]